MKSAYFFEPCRSIITLSITTISERIGNGNFSTTMSLQKSNFSSQNFPLADILVHKYFYLVNFLRYSVPLLMCGPTASLIVLRYVKTFFDQPAKKKKRYLRRKEKAARLAPRPIDLLRPAVSCMSIRYNMKIRKGRGFTPAELKVNHLLKTPKLYVP